MKTAANTANHIPTSDLAEAHRQIVESGAKVRGTIDRIRADIAENAKRLEVIRRAPASDDEIAARIDHVIAAAVVDARKGALFGILSKPAGQYSESAFWNAVDAQRAFKLLAVAAPEELKRGMFTEAKLATADAQAPQMPAARRDAELRELEQTLRGLQAREELCLRTLATAGLVINRRVGIPRDIADASVAELEAML